MRDEKRDAPLDTRRTACRTPRWTGVSRAESAAVLAEQHLLVDTIANAHGVAWLMFFIFVFCIANIRRELRVKRNIIGSVMEDYTSILALFPFALAQMEHEAESDPKLA